MTDTAKETTTTDSHPESKAGIEGTLVTEGSTPSTPETSEPPTQILYLDMEPLAALSANKVVRIPRSPSFSRKEVVRAFQSAFELIGGVPRLAIWADTNPNEFYKLYGKLLPSSNSSALGESSKLIIEMAIKPGKLDEAS